MTLLRTEAVKPMVPRGDYFLNAKLVLREEQVFRLYAYLSLTRFRRDYPILGCKGAEEALLAMAPEWTPLKSNNTMDPAAPSGRGSS
jgi:hypothetical protein